MMIASLSIAVLLLLYSSFGFAAELSLTLLNDAVDKVQGMQGPTEAPPSPTG